MGRIKCVKLECPIYNITGLAQIFLNNKGRIRYARVRHYKGLNEFKKPQFNYHKITDIEALKTLLKSQGSSFSTDKAIGQLGQGQTANTHYWSPKLKELGNRSFKALASMERDLLS